MKPRLLDEDPFSEFNCFPLGFYLDPEVWQVEAFRYRASVHHFRRLSKTARFAAEFAEQLSRGTWGEEHECGWTTLVAGRKRSTRFGVGAILPLTNNELLKAFVRLDRHGIGTRDRYEPAWCSVAQGAERPHIACIRFDIDLDQVFTSENLQRLVEVADACRAVGAVVQLTCSVMTTGRRGIQAHYTLPVRLMTADARMVRDALRSLLVVALPAHACLDKDSVDHLLRLPHTRHSKTKRLALYLDHSGQVLPVDEQVEAAVRAWTPTGAEEHEVLLARIGALTPPQRDIVAKQAVPELTPQRSGTGIFRGPKDEFWSSLIREPLVAGHTWNYLVDRRGVYAHIARFGKYDAKRRLLEKVLSMPDDGKLAERIAKVERLVDTFEVWQTEPSEFFEVVLTDDELRQVQSYVEELRASNARRDCISRQEMVYAAWLVAERLYGQQVSGARIARVAERLYGAKAPIGKSVYRALDMLRDGNKIWFVTLKPSWVVERITGGFVMPPEL